MDPEAFSKCSQTSFHTKLYASAYLHRNLKTHSVSSNRPRKLIEACRGFWGSFERPYLRQSVGTELALWDPNATRRALSDLISPISISVPVSEISATNRKSLVPVLDYFRLRYRHKT